MKKFLCVILAVMTVAAITCTQAFAASSACPRCAENVPISDTLGDTHAHIVGNKGEWYNSDGKCVGYWDITTTDPSDKENEYNAIIDAVNKACYTSGTPGAAESTGIMGADTTKGTVAFNGDLARLTNGVTWTLADGVLTVSGSGNMMRGSTYRIGNKWEHINPFVGNEHIETIVLDENLADICGATFSGIPNLKTIIIMDTGPYMTAFYDNSNLETIIVGANLADNPIENIYGVAKLAMTMPISTNPRAAAFVDTDVDIIVLTRGEYKSWGGDDDKFIPGIRDWDTAVADAKTVIANADLPESVMSKVPAALGGTGVASENESERINAFRGLHVSAWAEDTVWEAMQLGIIKPNERLGGTYYTNPINRANFCKLTTRLYETVTGSEITDYMNYSFTDDGFNKDIRKMAKLGIINGYGDGTFGYEDTLTREQAAVILARLAEVISGKTITEAKTPFVDTNTDWSASGIAKAYEMGVMNGTSDTTFSPKSNYTVEQSIITMVRLYEFLNK